MQILDRHPSGQVRDKGVGVQTDNGGAGMTAQADGD